MPNVSEARRDRPTDARTFSLRITTNTAKVIIKTLIPVKSHTISR